MKIKILTLSWCEKCEMLKKQLSIERIKYENVDAEINGKFADSIEDKYMTESYPIILLEDGTKVTVLLNETRLENAKDVIIFDTVEEAIELIKQKLYEV